MVLHNQLHRIRSHTRNMSDGVENIVWIQTHIQPIPSVVPPVPVAQPEPQSAGQQVPKEFTILCNCVLSVNCYLSPTTRILVVFYLPTVKSLIVTVVLVNREKLCGLSPQLMPKSSICTKLSICDTKKMSYRVKRTVCI